MIREFYEWWTGQLSECIPKQWRQAASSPQDAIAITPVGPIGPELKAISASTWSKGRETPLGQFRITARDLANLPKPARLPVVIRLSDSDVLCKLITLPLATERDLTQVLAFEMDRETPFSVDEIIWSYRVVDRDRQRGQLTVRLRLIARSTIAPLLEAIREAGVSVTRAEIVGGPDDGIFLPLGTDGAQTERTRWTYVLRWASATICLALGVAVVAMPFIRQAWDLAALDQEIAAGRGAAAQAEQLRRDIDRLEGAGNAIKNERVAAGDPLTTLAALTTVLPDDTYLTELQQQQHKVTFGGRSAAASRLIGAVATGSQLRNPVFAAPVTRMESTRTEVFSISVETGP